MILRPVQAPANPSILAKVFPEGGAYISILIILGHTSAECSESYSRGLIYW